MALSMSDSQQFAGSDYQRFRDFLQDACGILLGENKQYLVSSRLNKLMDEHQLTSLTALVEKMKDRRSGLREKVVDAMTTNETLWFRDTYPFDVLKDTLLPAFKQYGRVKPLKIWSAACSSGQEPYSISMAVSEFLSRNPGAFSAGVQIVATDISPSMLNLAKQAEYDALALARGLSTERRNRFFTQLPSGACKLKAEISNRVTFRPLNLLESYTALGKFDIIFCRNVLIYFSAELKTDILQRMSSALNSGGYLFLGASESMAGYCDRYDMQRCSPGIVYQVKAIK